MIEQKNNNISFTIEISETIYETVQKYQQRFKPQIGIEALMAELISYETRNWFVLQNKDLIKN